MARLLLLVPTATYRAPDFVDAALRLGVEIVVGSDREQAMGPAMGDRAIALNLADPEAAAADIAALAARSGLDAIVAVDDGGSLTAAHAAARLGLPHNPVEAVAATRDKAAMRAAFAAAGIEQPRHELLPAGADADPDGDAAAIVAEVGDGGPCVIKPLPLSASRGVIRVDDPAAAPAVAARVRAIVAAAGEDPDRPLLVERFVPGTEVAVEGLLRAGRLDLLALFDKPDPLDGPYFEETIYVTPSRHPAAVQQATLDLVARAAAALGLREGPIHAEARITADGTPVMLELAARSIGGLCGRALRFGAGVSLEEVILRHALGLPLDTQREGVAAGVMMLPIPASGRLEAVDGVDAARAVPGVEGLEITVPPGREVQALPEGDRYLGFLFARGDTPAQVETALRQAFARLEVRITPAAG